MTAPDIVKDMIRIGFVGTGGMGTHHIKNLSTMPGVRITALCDSDSALADRASAIIQQAGHPAPTLYVDGREGYKRLCAEEDVDVVYTATPWEYHTAVCVEAMENDKHAAKGNHPFGDAIISFCTNAEFFIH